jgi:Eco29kI restriction endonuclease
MPYQPEEISEYNPADLANLVRYCVQELMLRTPHPLTELERFDGAGIYALFYSGDFKPYQSPWIRSENATVPIYVGRARWTRSSGPSPLYRRLRDHLASVHAATNLEEEEFKCRFLVLHPLWVSTVEDLLIEHYHTLWNNVIGGFGLHDPGGKRHGGEMPPWDVLHPGRRHQVRMAERGSANRSIEDVLSLVRAYVDRPMIQLLPPPAAETDQLLRRSIRESEIPYETEESRQ